MNRTRIKRTIAALLIAGTSTMLIAPTVGGAEAGKRPHAILRAIL